ncbi:hypothetical protein MXB_2041 [Myxobolus squamalis]|nr:hypothetical protein MXB_2041 [Myxobolus squamalis]
MRQIRSKIYGENIIEDLEEKYTNYNVSSNKSSLLNDLLFDYLDSILYRIKSVILIPENCLYLNTQKMRKMVTTMGNSFIFLLLYLLMLNFVKQEATPSKI